MKFATPLFASLLTAMLLLAVTPHAIKTAQGTSPTAHEPLQIRNNFQTPEEVVAYYCGRDASGFVWSGLLNVEVRAFTTWKTAPEQDTFYIARDYRITRERATADQATIKVHYDILAIGDGNLTRMAAGSPDKDVTFELVKDQGRWKIARPDPSEISPVVLESKFPFGTPSVASETPKMQNTSQLQDSATSMPKQLQASFR